MYPAPWSSLPDFVAHDWLPYSGERSLTEVAVAMCAVRGIHDGDTLVGCSLGGMVACEITKIRRIPTLYLVGSATHKEEVGGLLTILHPLARAAPLDWLKLVAGKIPGEVARMFAGVEPAFIRAMGEAMFVWEGLGATPTKVYRIHGRHDFVIPPPEKVDLLLDGGHLIAMTHAQQCVEFVRAGAV